MLNIFQELFQVIVNLLHILDRISVWYKGCELTLQVPEWVSRGPSDRNTVSGLSIYYHHHILRVNCDSYCLPATDTTVQPVVEKYVHRLLGSTVAKFEPDTPWLCQGDPICGCIARSGWWYSRATGVCNHSFEMVVPSIGVGHLNIFANYINIGSRILRMSSVKLWNSQNSNPPQIRVWGNLCNHVLFLFCVGLSLIAAFFSTWDKWLSQITSMYREEMGLLPDEQESISSCRLCQQQPCHLIIMLIIYDTVEGLCPVGLELFCFSVSKRSGTPLIATFQSQESCANISRAPRQSTSCCLWWLFKVCHDPLPHHNQTARPALGHSLWCIMGQSMIFENRSLTTQMGSYNLHRCHPSTMPIVLSFLGFTNMWGRLSITIIDCFELWVCWQVSHFRIYPLRLFCIVIRHHCWLKRLNGFAHALSPTCCRLSYFWMSSNIKES